MASEGPERISVSEESRISRPVLQERLPVSWADWDFIKGRIRRCEVKIDVWAMATSFFFGVATLASSIALTSDANSVSARWPDAYWGLAVGGFIVGIVCLLARVALGSSQHQSINSVLEDMIHIEQRYERPPSEIQNP
jgi:hypothetical protein